MNYVVYTRVSPRGSRWEGETSCDAQAEECRRAILARDPSASISVVTDEFLSGTNNARPALQRILREIDSAKWDVLVCLDMDRLARSQEGWVEISRLLSRHQKGLICVRQNADFSSIQGRMMLGLFAVIGEYFAKQSAQRTLDKMRHMARQGLWGPGVVPYGYRRRGKADNVLVPHDAEADVVKQIFARYAAGTSTVKLARELDISEDRITRILKSEVYIGRIRYGEVTADGKHEPIIGEDLFRAAAARLPKGVTGPRANAHIYDYLLAGLIFCECGATMAASYAIGGSGNRYPRYRCGNQRCKAKTRLLRADLIERIVMERIAYSAENDKDVEENYRRIVDAVATIRKQADAPLAELRAKLAPLETRAANLSSGIQAGSFGPAAIRALANDLEALHGQIGGIRAEIIRHEAEIDAAIRPDTVEQLAAAWRQTARDLVNSTDTARRREWVRYHIQDIRIEGDTVNIRFWASPKKVCITGGGWYPGRWLCTLSAELKKH